MEKELEKLDDKGFVFIGADGRPYWCRIWGESAWFMYWHADKRWVSLKKVNQTEVWQANNKALPEDQANMYNDLHNNYGITNNLNLWILK